MAVVHGLLHCHREHSAAGEGHVNDEFQAHCLDAGEHLQEEAAHVVGHQSAGGQLSVGGGVGVRVSTGVRNRIHEGMCVN